MAIKQLTDEQIQNWTLEQKDRWWLENVFRGNMAQLTLRSALMGFLLGGVLSATNLYVGAKTGWSLGVGITSVILAFAFFRALQQAGMKEFTILENNCVQSIATSAGYMTSPLISSLVAYMLVDGRLLAWHQIILWNIVLSILGVLFAFPMKRRFINDEQHPFPEGRACGVVLDTLHTSEGRTGVFKAKLLVVVALAAAAIKFTQAESIQKAIQFKLLGRHASLSSAVDAAKESLNSAKQAVIGASGDALIAANGAVEAAKAAVSTAQGALNDKLIYFPEHLGILLRKVGIPDFKINRINATSLTVEPVLDLALMGAGGLMGIRAATSLMIGSIINYCILVPMMAHRGDIPLNPAKDAILGGFGKITLWSLWPGVACMVVASFVAFFAKPKLIINAVTGMFGRNKQKSDVLNGIELPLWVSIVGIPIFSILAAILANLYFGVNVWVALAGLPLAFVLCLIAANSTALTGTTPVGATAKITQLFYGAIAPNNIKTNLATGSMTGEVVSNSSNLLMDIKPGYMLGAKPRQQAIGHVIGIFSGAIASTPLFFILFTQKIDKTSPETVAATIGNLQTGDHPMPSASVWKGVAEVLTKGFNQLPDSVVWAIVVASFVGLVFEVSRIATKGRFLLSPVAMGLAFVIHFYYALAFFLGALIFWLAGVGRKKAETHPNLITQNHEPICAGIIAGAALMGIVDACVAAFILV